MILARIISILVEIYIFLIAVWCLLTWLPIQRGTLMGDIMEVIGRIVTPYLNIFKRIVPPILNIDFSPILAIAVLVLLERVFIGILL